MLRWRRLAAGWLLFWLGVAGCGGSAIADSGHENESIGGDPGCPTGSVGCPCYPNDTCDGDLVCASDVCVEPGAAGGSDAGGTAGTMSSGAGGSAGAGGSVATGGSAGASGGGSGGVALCSNVTPCGGELVGTWTVTASCLTATGEVDLSQSAIFCTAPLVAGSLEVSGTWTARGDGTFLDETRTTGRHQLALGEDCKWFMGTTRISCEKIGGALMGLGYADASCVDDATTGGCTCEAVIDQPGPYASTGGIGFAPNPEAYPVEAYSTDGDVLTIGQASYSYCVSGTKLILTPVGAPGTGTLVGSVELQR